MAPPDTPVTPPTAKKTNMPTLPNQIPSPEMYDEIFLIKVGKAPKTHVFPIHKGVARFYSGYFTAALRDDTFKEGKENMIVLEDEDIDCFRIFTAWLYKGRIQDNSAEKEFMPLIKLWIMSDRYDVPMLGNQVIDVIHEKAVRQNMIPIGSINYVYDNTSGPCGIRQWTVDAILSSMSTNTFAKEISTSINAPMPQCHDFLYDMALAGMNYRDYMIINKGCHKGWGVFDMCCYHIHKEGEKCSKT